VRCYFLRHGIAVEAEDWNGRDADRPLTREGRARMEREAIAIGTLPLKLESILTSPLLRAKQTAEIVAQRLGLCDHLFEDERLAGHFNVERFAAILAGHAQLEAVLLVGHEPTMSATIGQLVGDAGIEFKKGALAGLEVTEAASAGATLLFLYPPKILVKLADA
jgi:phosphohistidine phosphatase